MLIHPSPLVDFIWPPLLCGPCAGGRREVESVDAMRLHCTQAGCTFQVREDWLGMLNMDEHRQTVHGFPAQENAKYRLTAPRLPGNFRLRRTSSSISCCSDDPDQALHEQHRFPVERHPNDETSSKQQSPTPTHAGGDEVNCLFSPSSAPLISERCTR